MQSLISSKLHQPIFRQTWRLLRFGFFFFALFWLAQQFVREQPGLIRQWRDAWVGLRTSGGIGPTYQLDQPSKLTMTASQAAEIIQEINQRRTQQNLAILASPAALQKTAAELAALTVHAAQDQQELSEATVQEVLSKARLTSTYGRVTSATQLGSMSMADLISQWLQSSSVDGGILDSSASAVGVGMAKLDDQSVVAVRLLVWPAPERAAQTSPRATSTNNKTAAGTMPPLPFISDTDMILALNQYRADHQVHQLVEHQLLCNYAAKRVKDLVAAGGLDNHEGFRQDFADPSHPPEILADYPGRTIGENLASQYCRNMQTGDSFIAQNATSLIEWCFDSSTKGHREAQLNPAYNNVCARHENGLFVVIFGD